jgi:RNA polymerase sigma factor (TIGR02999 family)
MGSSDDDVTALLQAWSAGDVTARDRLVPLVYAELRRRAAASLRSERSPTLQPTALVHEVYLRLIDQNRTDWQNRRQFFSIASQAMRRILVDRARARRMQKRSGRWSRVTLDDHLLPGRERDIEILDLDRALSRLGALDPRKSEIAELRFFGGLSLEETADLLDVSRSTVERDWQAARAWLFRELTAQHTKRDD